MGFSTFLSHFSIFFSFFSFQVDLRACRSNDRFFVEIALNSCITRCRPWRKLRRRHRAEFRGLAHMSRRARQRAAITSGLTVLRSRTRNANWKLVLPLFCWRRRERPGTSSGRPRCWLEYFRARGANRELILHMASVVDTECATRESAFSWVAATLRVSTRPPVDGQSRFNRLLVMSRWFIKALPRLPAMRARAVFTLWLIDRRQLIDPCADPSERDNERASWNTSRRSCSYLRSPIECLREILREELCAN